ncbi:armadillo-type protein [Catenaria anguillulae PL171]|uniref:Armadillo-type protein n=1 Tax=Catenaria anguillulae PL171 TaxID=765915 RepID=A0A1Y2HHJ9_9FUNG|nr:armadillo-type protein [Catenaria anguillulae PL171]
MTITMDPQAFYSALRGSLSPDANARMHGELELKRLEQLAGYAPLCLQVAVTEQDPALRMSAAVCFKNKVRQGWVKGVSENDKDVIKQQIVAALVQAPASIRSQLTLALHFMLNHDFPAKWPQYIEQVGQFVQQTADANAVHGGLLALQEVVLVFQWKSKKERTPLNHIVKTIFPYLLQIATSLLPHDNIEAAHMLKIIAKTYHASIHAQLSKAQMERESLSGWCSLFTQLIAKPLPAAVQAELDAEDDEEAKAQNPWWKAKKWAFHSLNHLNARYGNSKQDRFVDDKQYKAFSKMYMADFAPGILQAYLAFTEQMVATRCWVSPRIRYLLSRFFADSIGHKSSWALIKPFAQQLIEHLVHPILILSASDLEQWEDDPAEYSPASGANMLLISLATQRRKHTFEGIVQYIHQVMVAYTNAPSEQTALAKEGALHMLSQLAPHCLAENSPVVGQMESFLVSYVFPEFTSPIKFLRARALATVAAFAELQFANPANAIVCLQAAMQGLQDAELPIRVEAAVALRPMLEIQVALLDLQNTIEMDTITEVMESIVEEFATEVAPFAVDLAAQLGSTFIRIMTEAQEGLDSQYVPSMDDDDADASYFDVATEKTMAAMGVLKTMQTLVLSVQESDEIVLRLEEAMLPSLVYVLDHQIIDLYPDVFELVDACTFALKAVSPTMWALFDKLHAVCRTDAADYVCEMVPALDNYVSYGKDQFAVNRALQQAMVDMVDLCLTADELGEADRVCGCQLIESMLLHLRGGHIDHLVPHFLGRAMAYISANKFKTSHFRVSAIEVGVNALYYDPVLTLRVMEENGWTAPFFAAWMSVVPKMSRVHDKKLGIVALCSIMRVPLDKLPATVQQGLPQLMAAMISFLSTMDKAVENRESEERFFTGIDTGSADEGSTVEARELNDEDEEEVLDEGVAGADDGEWEDEDEGDELYDLARQAREAREGGFDDDDFEDDDDELIEEITLETPLDPIDPFIAFATVFTEIQQSNPAVYQHLTAGMAADHQNAVMLALQRASENQAKAAAAAAAAGSQ